MHVKNANEQLRTDSGSVDLSDRLIGFLYDLMRDHVVPGTIEKLVRVAESQATQGENYFCNGWLAKYAENLAKRLGFGYYTLLAESHKLQSKNFDSIKDLIQYLNSSKFDDEFVFN